MSNGLHSRKKETPFQKLSTFSKSVDEPLSQNRDPNMTQNEHVYAICCGLEVDNDVISGRNATIEGYIVVNFEVVSSSGFRDFPKCYVLRRLATAAVA